MPVYTLDKPAGLVKSLSGYPELISRQEMNDNLYLKSVNLMPDVTLGELRLRNYISQYNAVSGENIPSSVTTVYGIAVLSLDTPATQEIVLVFGNDGADDGVWVSHQWNSETSSFIESWAELVSDNVDVDIDELYSVFTRQGVLRAGVGTGDSNYPLWIGVIQEPRPDTKYTENNINMPSVFTGTGDVDPDNDGSNDRVKFSGQSWNADQWIGYYFMIGDSGTIDGYITDSGTDWIECAGRNFSTKDGESAVIRDYRNNGIYISKSELTAPDTGNATLTSAYVDGGGLTAGNTYYYKFVFEYDSFQYSLPSASKSITVGAGDNAVCITFKWSSSDSKRISAVRVYRSTDNSTFYYLGYANSNWVGQSAIDSAVNIGITGITYNTGTGRFEKGAASWNSDQWVNFCVRCNNSMYYVNSNNATALTVTLITGDTPANGDDATLVTYWYTKFPAAKTTSHTGILDDTADISGNNEMYADIGIGSDVTVSNLSSNIINYKYITSVNDRTFIGNTAAQDDEVRYCLADEFGNFQVDSFLDTNALLLEHESKDSIESIMSYLDKLIIWKRVNFYLVDLGTGNEFTWTLEEFYVKTGLVSHWAIERTLDVPYFLSDVGLKRYNRGILEEDFDIPIGNVIDKAQQNAQIESSALVYDKFNDRLYLTLYDTSTTRNMMVFCLRNGQWSEIATGGSSDNTNIKLFSSASMIDRTLAVAYNINSSDYYIVEFNAPSGSEFDSQQIKISFQTKDYIYPGISYEKLLNYISIEYLCSYDTGGTIKLYIDYLNTASGTINVITVDLPESSTYITKNYNLPFGKRGDTISARIEGTKITDFGLRRLEINYETEEKQG